MDHYVVEVDGQMYDVPAGEGYATISKTYGQNNLRNDYFKKNGNEKLRKGDEMETKQHMNADYVKREDVIRIITPRLNSSRPGSLEHQRMYSILHEVEKLPGKQVEESQKESWMSGKCKISYEPSASSKEIILTATGIDISTRNLSNKDIVDVIKQKFPHFCINEITHQDNELRIVVAVINPDEYPKAILDMVERGNLKMEWNFARDTKDINKEDER